MSGPALHELAVRLILVLIAGSAMILVAAVIGARAAGRGNNRVAGSLCGFGAGIAAVIGISTMGSRSLLLVAITGLGAAFGVGYAVAASLRYPPHKDRDRDPEST
jgi:hypothetical protein